ncbi:hypothetical protein Pcinc_036769 [Petrolisthes cinctipes]|uniref:Uncharacterized protein n=1 Tax=Petrolisthes cinctipes TaxID=88211 RepID=A0AAE1BXY8_PETCI|nr:hypothetical protein Pcinc_036769 [Petrolisthes cinctipes]
MPILPPHVRQNVHCLDRSPFDSNIGIVSFSGSSRSAAHNRGRRRRRREAVRVGAWRESGPGGRWVGREQDRGGGGSSGDWSAVLVGGGGGPLHLSPARSVRYGTSVRLHRPPPVASDTVSGTQVRRPRLC